MHEFMNVKFTLPVSVNKPNHFEFKRELPSSCLLFFWFLDFYCIVQCHLNRSMNFGFVQCVNGKHVAI